MNIYDYIGFPHYCASFEPAYQQCHCDPFGTQNFTTPHFYPPPPPPPNDPSWASPFAKCGVNAEAPENPFPDLEIVSVQELEEEK